NSYGDTLWAKKYADMTQCHGNSIDTTSDGGYVITGSCDVVPNTRHLLLIKINANGDTLLTRNFGAINESETGTAVHQAADGGYFMTGYESVPSYPDTYIG